MRVAHRVLLLAALVAMAPVSAAGGEDEVLAFGLTQKNFVDLNVCHLEAMTQAYETLASRGPAVARADVRKI